MWLLTLRDLRFRARRFGVAVAAMSLVITLLYLMTGLVEQFNQEPHLTAGAIGARSWVLPPGVSGPFTSSATLSAEEVASVPGDLDEVVVARATLDVAGEDQESLVVGHELEALGTPPVSAGRSVGQRGEVVLDRSAGASVGDRVGIGDSRFTVVGLTDDTTLLAGLPVVFASIEDAREVLFGGVPVVSALVSETEVPPVGDLVATTAEEVGEDALGPLENAISSIDLIRGLLWLVAAIIIGGVLYLTALERRRDFAVMRAVGGTNLQLGWGLAVQGVALALAAVALATALQVLIVPVFPLTVRVPGRAYWQIPLLAGVVALLATRAGSSRARRTDPAAAFGGP
ncbi:MAG: ABC transporter permease [Actinomycetota bacterium]